MSSFVKYKIREVAKDFDMPTKSVMNMVTEHFEAPKSSAQVLSDDQLNLVFDLITRENQIDSIEEVFAARMLPPYRSASMIRWSPGLNSSITRVIAAIPVEKASASIPFSKVATIFSRCSLVGFCSLL